MDKNGMIGELLEKGQSAAVNTAKTTVSDVANTVKGQLGLPNEKGGTNKAQDNHNNQGQNIDPNQQARPSESAQANNPDSAPDAMANEQTKEMVKDFYSPSKPANGEVSPQQEEAETKQRLEALRMQLHDEVYYQPLINPKKNEQEEERPAERVERQDQEKMQDLQKKEKEKPPPIAVQRAQTSTEMNRGVSG